MNKKILALTLAGTLALSSSSYAAIGLDAPVNISNTDVKITAISAPVQKSYELLIDGKKIDMLEDTKQPFINDEGILMVPLRIVAESLGYEVNWKGETTSAELIKGAQFTSVTIGKDAYFFAKMAPISLKQAPVVMNNRTYVPVQFFEDILKKYVVYDGNRLNICNFDETTKDDYLFNSNDDLGWVFDAADYPVNVKDEDWDIGSVIGVDGHTGSNVSAYWLIGDNHSDDLFLYTYKKIQGLHKNTKYNALIDIEAVTPYGQESMGIGGSPAGSVYLKAGVVNVEPKAVSGKYHGSEDYYLLPSSIKKGNQANDGEHIRYISTLADQTGEENGLFNIKQSLNTSFTTNENGEAWVLVGIDSGFEGLNILGIKSIGVNLSKVEVVNE